MSVLCSNPICSGWCADRWSLSFLFTAWILTKLDRYFTKTHEWVEVKDNVGTVGITTEAANALGDIVFVELPNSGDKFAQAGNLAAVESVKASAVVYSPVSGTVSFLCSLCLLRCLMRVRQVVGRNEAVLADNSIVNKSAESDGWLVKVQLSKPEELKSLLTRAQYEEATKAEGH